MAARWESEGWEVTKWEENRLWGRLLLCKTVPQHRRALGTPTGWLVLAVVAALVITVTGVLTRDYFSEVRTDARTAARALKDGDLTASGQVLAAYRGDPDFAHFFATQITPRDIGDALATVGGPSEDEPFRAGVDTQDYEIVLTDLAGTLALATHDRGERVLPEAWTEDFITATTTPLELYGEASWFDADEKQRERQDLANKTNLLLVLSRGYWSTEFLQAVTQEYYEFDQLEGKDAWPTARRQKGGQLAPAPSGAYLTDGILALTAALTANPEAAEWAFAEFQPGTVGIAETDHVIGRFTHFLLFEHRFPETSDGESVGVTSVLTALSAAVDSATWASGPEAAVSFHGALTDIGPLHDAAVLQALAVEITAASGCSWDPRDYWSCTKAASEVVGQWIERWGHDVLDILTTIDGPLSYGAAATNIAWYTIEGDYEQAGLSLVTAVPDLPFSDIYKGVKKGTTVVKSVRDQAHIARITKQIRESVDHPD